MIRNGERSIASILLFLSLVFFLWYAWASVGVYQGGDTFQHYLIARYAFYHPHLFLDHWGKPVFTAIYALPSLGGYAWAELTTVVIGLATALMTYLTARKLELKYSWSVIVLLLFTPMFFVHLNSVMTEILFSFWLISGIFFILTRRFSLAAVFLSFLPFVRTEGFILLPCIAVYFAMERQWKPFLLLGTGLILYSLLGLVFYYHDFFWVFNNNPYRVVSPYGSGDMLHFLKSNKVIWGIPISIAVAISILVFTVNAFQRRHLKHNRIWWMLITIPFLIFLLFHSIAWATGTLASNGELRVMACTAPLTALLACSVFTAFQSKGKFSFLKVAAWLLFLAVVIITPFQLFKTPVPKTVAQQMTEAACTYIEVNLPGRCIHYVDPLIAVKMNRNPYDPTQLMQWYSDPEHPEKDMKPGDLVIWDAHFTAHEGRVDYERLNANPEFRMVATFKPEKPHIIFGSEEYFVAIFEYIRQR
ncbi:MAG: hypothetical protein ACKVOK_08515 [Flavobacteriales bacterium]